MYFWNLCMAQECETKEGRYNMVRHSIIKMVRVWCELATTAKLAGGHWRERNFEDSQKGALHRLGRDACSSDMTNSIIGPSIEFNWMLGKEFKHRRQNVWRRILAVDRPNTMIVSFQETGMQIALEGLCQQGKNHDKEDHQHRPSDEKSKKRHRVKAQKPTR